MPYQRAMEKEAIAFEQQFDKNIASIRQKYHNDPELALKFALDYIKLLDGPTEKNPLGWGNFPLIFNARMQQTNKGKL